MKEDQKYRKILFELDRDDDGYPPDDWESVWGVETENGCYRIDNIPFYIRGISVGDTVSVEAVDDELFFDELVEKSGHSVFRLIISDPAETQEIRSELKNLSCDTEASHIEGFISVDCPPVADFSRVLDYLQAGEDDGRWEFEEASLRHED